MLKNRQNKCQNSQKIVKNVEKPSKISKNSRKTVKIFEKTSKMLKNLLNTTNYAEKPLKNRQKCAKT